jgi:hypothetical protein
MVVVSWLTISVALTSANMTIHSAYLGVAAIAFLGTGIGWPLGFLLGGREVAFFGAIIGVLVIFGILVAYAMLASDF